MALIGSNEQGERAMDAKSRVIRRRQVLQIIGLSYATQWRMEKAGLFPARVRLGKGSVGWLLNEVEDWIQNRERVVR